MLMRATRERVTWGEQSEEPTVVGGFCDPDDPWNQSKWMTVPDGFCGTDFVAWREANVITLDVSPQEAADRKAVFPGGVWDERESESTMRMNGACESVTLHVEEV